MVYHWKLGLIAPFRAIPIIDTILEGDFTYISWYAVLPDNQRKDEPDANEDWRLEAVSEVKPDKDKIDSLLAVIAQKEAFEIKDMRLVKEEPRDWLKENLEQFPAIEVGPFYIYGRHIQEAIPQGKIGIQMDAAQAFGTGQHATTKSCLQLIAQLKEKDNSIKNILDMGAGSGILSFAAAQLWQCPVLAVDVDPLAPDIIKQYAKDNGVAVHISAVLGDGYQTKEVLESAGFDLICSNILANPLIDMASELSAKLTKGAYAILSGFLSQDSLRVQKAYEQQGLKLITHITEDDWVALTLQKV